MRKDEGKRGSSRKIPTGFSDPKSPRNGSLLSPKTLHESATETPESVTKSRKDYERSRKKILSIPDMLQIFLEKQALRKLSSFSFPYPLRALPAAGLNLIR